MPQQGWFGLVDPELRSISRHRPKKPSYLPDLDRTQVAIVAIHELSLRKFRKMGRMTSFAVVSLIETSFPFYEWYKLRLFSFNTINQSSIYTREEGEERSEEGEGWFRWSVVRHTPINKIIIDTLLKVLPHTLCKTKKFKGLLSHSRIKIITVSHFHSKMLSWVLRSLNCYYLNRCCIPLFCYN